MALERDGLAPKPIGRNWLSRSRRSLKKSQQCHRGVSDVNMGPASCSDGAEGVLSVTRCLAAARLRSERRPGRFFSDVGFKFILRKVGDRSPRRCDIEVFTFGFTLPRFTIRTDNEASLDFLFVCLFFGSSFFCIK